MLYIAKESKRKFIMAISIKSSPVLTGITAKRFDALVEQNKSIDARTLSETEKNQIDNVLMKSKNFSF